MDPRSSNPRCSRVKLYIVIFFILGVLPTRDSFDLGINPTGAWVRRLEKSAFYAVECSQRHLQNYSAHSGFGCMLSVWFLLSFSLVALLGMVLCCQLGNFKPTFISSPWDEVGFPTSQVFLNRTESFKTIGSCELSSTSTLVGAGWEEDCV